MSVIDVLIIICGTPRAIFRAHLAAALAWLCPCPASHVVECEAVHARVSSAVATVAIEQRDPYEAAARLLGTCAHEGACWITVQRNGPAVSPWHLEVVRAQRAALQGDDVAAARLALSRAGGDLRAYACGGATCDDEHEASAAGLRSAVQSARFALARVR